LFDSIITQIGNNEIFVEELNNTNDALKLLLETKVIVEGTALYTNFQTGGRGQLSNVWESEKDKNLLLSIYLKPDFIEIEDQAALNMLICLSVLELVKKYVNSEVFIKWPNDIYVNDQKICGILVENVIQGKKIKCCIAGIGLNVNQLRFINKNATSLALQTSENYDLKLLRSELYAALEKRYFQLRTASYKKLIEDFEGNLYRRNKIQKFLIKGNIVDATIIGIDNFGRLKVLIKNELILFANKEIEMIFD